MNSKSPMRKLYDSKIFWMIISLAVSLAIWIYVTSVEGDEFRQTFRNVRVELVGEENFRPHIDAAIEWAGKIVEGSNNERTL